MNTITETAPLVAERQTLRKKLGTCRFLPHKHKTETNKESVLVVNNAGASISQASLMRTDRRAGDSSFFFFFFHNRTKVSGPQRRQMRLFPSSISSWTLSLEVAISACAEKTAQMKVSTVPPMAV